MAHAEENEDINIIDFIQSRSKEIQAIEDSINKTSKKTMLFQRLPFYKRRRNRNYDKRQLKKFSYRKRDRHFLRTHNYYAKRFFMLKVENFSIPFRRRLKSSKYIYKSQDRGFIFDESFRGATEYKREDVFGSNSVGSPADDGKDCENGTIMMVEEFLNKINGSKEIQQYSYGIVQQVDNEYEIIFKKESVILIGKRLNITGCPIDCVFSVIHKDRLEEILESPFSSNMKYSFYKAKCDYSTQDKTGSYKSLETYKIFCARSEVMNVYQKMINGGVVPICLLEIHRLALENNLLTVYDNVSSALFKKIEKSSCRDIIEKYDRTPPSKRQEYNLNLLFLSNERVYKYFIFRILKGTADAAAEIFSESQVEFSEEMGGFSCVYRDPVGRVVRSAYKFGSGKCFGLGFFKKPPETSKCCFEPEDDLILCIGKKFLCKNLSQDNFYELEIVRIFD